MRSQPVVSGSRLSTARARRRRAGNAVRGSSGWGSSGCLQRAQVRGVSGGEVGRTGRPVGFESQRQRGAPGVGAPGSRAPHQRLVGLHRGRRAPAAAAARGEQQRDAAGGPSSSGPWVDWISLPGKAARVGRRSDHACRRHASGRDPTALGQRRLRRPEMVADPAGVGRHRRRLGALGQGGPSVASPSP